MAEKPVTIRKIMPHLILCDLDGTLIRHGHPMSAETRDVIDTLHKRGDVVAIASGRSLYSGRNVLTDPLSIGYWIFSTGAGILEWKSKTVVRKLELDKGQVTEIAEVLSDMEADFMIQDPIPDNHCFVYRKFSNPENEGTDFIKRCSFYEEYCRPVAEEADLQRPASQLICVLPPDLLRIEEIRKRLSAYSVVRATSPMDNKSVWLEIFAPGVGKAAGGAWLASLPELGIEDTFAIGNDYNDLDMLEWADHAFVTPNAPDDLKERFPTTSSDTEGALAEAVRKWSKYLL